MDVPLVGRVQNVVKHEAAVFPRAAGDLGLRRRVEVGCSGRVREGGRLAGLPVVRSGAGRSLPVRGAGRKQPVRRKRRDCDASCHYETPSCDERSGHRLLLL